MFSNYYKWRSFNKYLENFITLDEIFSHEQFIGLYMRHVHFFSPIQTRNYWFFCGITHLFFKSRYILPAFIICLPRILKLSFMANVSLLFLSHFSWLQKIEATYSPLVLFYSFRSDYTLRLTYTVVETAVIWLIFLVIVWGYV